MFFGVEECDSFCENEFLSVLSGVESVMCDIHGETWLTK